MLYLDFFFQKFLEHFLLFSSIRMYFNSFLHQKQKKLRLESNRHTKIFFCSSTFNEKRGLMYGFPLVRFFLGSKNRTIRGLPVHTSRKFTTIMEYKPACAAVERAWGKLGKHSKKSLQNRIHTLVVNKSDLSIHCKFLLHENYGHRALQGTCRFFLHCCVKYLYR